MVHLILTAPNSALAVPWVKGAFPLSDNPSDGIAKELCQLRFTHQWVRLPLALLALRLRPALVPVLPPVRPTFLDG